MNTKHTPGPWRTGEPFAIFDGADLRFHISQDDGAPFTPHYSDVAQFVAETIPGEKLEIQKANARLIAAAPDLLEALQAAVECGMVPTSSGRDGGAVRHVRQVQVADMIRAAIAKATGAQP